MIKIIFQKVIISVFATIVIVIVSFFVTTTINKAIIPFIDELFYKGPLIEGSWIAKVNFPDDSYNINEIRISRWGYNVRGKVRCVEGYSKGQDFALEGKVKSNIVYVSYNTLVRGRTECGNAIILIDPNSDRGAGGMVFTSDHYGILTGSISIEKQKDGFSWE